MKFFFFRWNAGPKYRKNIWNWGGGCAVRQKGCVLKIIINLKNDYSIFSFIFTPTISHSNKRSFQNKFMSLFLIEILKLHRKVNKLFNIHWIPVHTNVFKNEIIDREIKIAIRFELNNHEIKFFSHVIIMTRSSPFTHRILTFDQSPQNAATYRNFILHTTATSTTRSHNAAASRRGRSGGSSPPSQSSAGDLARATRLQTSTTPEACRVAFVLGVQVPPCSHRLKFKPTWL